MYRNDIIEKSWTRSSRCQSGNRFTELKLVAQRQKTVGNAATLALDRDADPSSGSGWCRRCDLSPPSLWPLVLHCLSLPLLSSGGYTISVCNQPTRSTHGQLLCQRLRFVLTIFGAILICMYVCITQPCIPPGSRNRVPASAEVKAGMSALPGGR